MRVTEINVMDGGREIEVAVSDADFWRLHTYLRAAREAFKRVADEDEATAAADAICGRLK